MAEDLFDEVTTDYIDKDEALGRLVVISMEGIEFHHFPASPKNENPYDAVDLRVRFLSGEVTDLIPEIPWTADYRVSNSQFVAALRKRIAANNRKPIIARLSRGKGQKSGHWYAPVALDAFYAGKKDADALCAKDRAVASADYPAFLASLEPEDDPFDE